MTLTEIQQAIDADLELLWPALAAIQAGELTASGRHAQALKTHSVLPANGERRAPDRLDAKPAHRGRTARQIFGALMPAATRSALSIDEYIGPQGPGWVLRLEFEYQGQVWRKARQSGPEGYHAHGWRPYDPGDIGFEPGP